MRYATLGLLVFFAFPSCSKRPYEAEWERPDSALDPVGLAAHKKDARERAEQSKFKKGDKVAFRGAKLMMFEQNPETSFVVTGTPVSADSGVILEPGPLYVKVEFNNGTRGFVNVSDIIDPMENSFGLLPVGANVALPVMPGGDEEMPAFLKAVEEMPDSSLEPSSPSGILPNNAVKGQPSAAPANAGPNAVSSPAAAAPAAGAPQSGGSQPAVSPAPAPVQPQPSKPENANPKASDSKGDALPPSSAETGGKKAS